MSELIEVGEIMGSYLLESMPVEAVMALMRLCAFQNAALVIAVFVRLLFTLFMYI
jgi:hypothetical protein